MKNIGSRTALNQDLLSFLNESPNGYFVVANLASALEKEGYHRLSEQQRWDLSPGQGYYVVRNDSALIAFQVPEGSAVGFQIVASHCDSPTFRIKPNAELSVDNRFVRLNVEKYGGILLAPWFDRPLSVAGRLLVRDGSSIRRVLVNVDRDLLIIPNVAIHMNRGANDGFQYNIQTDLLPLFSMSQEPGSFLKLVAQEAGVKPEDILDTDLFLYNRMRGTFLGADQEFIASVKLDDCQCAYSTFRGFLAAQPERSVAVYALFDNEEVGSRSLQGAAGSFLSDTLQRINRVLGGDGEDYRCRLARSFVISADNAHSVHPNHPEKADPSNRPYMNGGVVVKYAANQKYTTDGVSGALFRAYCEAAGVPWQTFVNRSDMQGGSTLGNISLSQVSVYSVDVGLPQLSMHSSYETAGTYDSLFLAKATKACLSSWLELPGDGRICLHGEAAGYRISLAKESDVPAILALIEETYAQMEDKELYVRTEGEEDWLLERITGMKKGFVLKAVSPEGDLASFLLVDFPGNSPSNMACDLGLPSSQYKAVAHMDSCMVVPAHRGHHLQARLCEAAEGYMPTNIHLLLSTVSPQNPASYRSMEMAGYERVMVKEKYGGHVRAIYRKECGK